jgi:hypothetical protein
MKSKTEQINDILESVIDDEGWKPYAEYTPGKGWFVITPEPRWFGDRGEFLGKDFKSAIAAAKNIYQ